MVFVLYCGTPTLVLQVDGGLGGLHHPGGKPGTPAGGAGEVLLDPVKQPGVCVPGAARLVEVYDASSVRTGQTAENMAN